MTSNNQNRGRSGEERSRQTNKEYGRQGKYSKGNKKNSDS
ncbi:hypothetical protein SAMN05216362_1139 [Piscibacillus halophilus]|uniref:Uncharacterized protein n=1 Tax=Piscibacillus halophilus TaxID=571933 RepID=A0A1H9FSF4_9BACI|nr:hypothetical protein SAMN05216362_1139 [Piscibacillus halophilus]